jgi:hypothetical protein
MGKVGEGEKRFLGKELLKPDGLNSTYFSTHLSWQKRNIHHKIKISP